MFRKMILDVAYLHVCHAKEPENSQVLTVRDHIGIEVVVLWVAASRTETFTSHYDKQQKKNLLSQEIWTLIPDSPNTTT